MKKFIVLAMIFLMSYGCSKESIFIVGDKVINDVELTTYKNNQILQFRNWDVFFEIVKQIEKNTFENSTISNNFHSLEDELSVLKESNLEKLYFEDKNLIEKYFYIENTDPLFISFAKESSMFKSSLLNKNYQFLVNDTLCTWDNFKLIQEFTDSDNNVLKTTTETNVDRFNPNRNFNSYCEYFFEARNAISGIVSDVKLMTRGQHEEFHGHFTFSAKSQARFADDPIWLFFLPNIYSGLQIFGTWEIIGKTEHFNAFEADYSVTVLKNGLYDWDNIGLLSTHSTTTPSGPIFRGCHYFNVSIY